MDATLAIDILEEVLAKYPKPDIFNSVQGSQYSLIRDLKEGIKTYIYKYNFKRFYSSLNYRKPMKVYENNEDS